MREARPFEFDTPSAILHSVLMAWVGGLIRNWLPTRSGSYIGPVVIEAAMELMASGFIDRVFSMGTRCPARTNNVNGVTAAHKAVRNGCARRGLAGLGAGSTTFSELPTITPTAVAAPCDTKRLCLEIILAVVGWSAEAGEADWDLLGSCYPRHQLNTSLHVGARGQKSRPITPHSLRRRRLRLQTAVHGVILPNAGTHHEFVGDSGRCLTFTRARCAVGRQ